MKDIFIKKTMSFITTNNHNIDKFKLEEIRYGFEYIYLSITKFFIILLFSYFLGIMNEFLFFLILYNIIRFFSFGLHFDKSYICFIFSTLIFLSFPFLAQILTIPFEMKIMICVFSFVVFCLYAPADTKKRPLIKKEKRKKYKFLSIFVIIIYIFLSFFINDSFIVNNLLFSMIIQSILILPITYAFFKLPYQNYKTYQ